MCGMGYGTGPRFIGAPGTTVPGTGAPRPYAMCAGAGRFTGVPTADTRGPPIGCPMVGAAYIPTLGVALGVGGAGFVDFPECAAEPFVWPVIGP